MRGGRVMHIHLDAVGGVAGDMFIAAVLDAFPNLRDGMMASIRVAGLPETIGLDLQMHRDHALTGMRFAISEANLVEPAGHHHRSFADIRCQLRASELRRDVCAVAIDIFTLLAEAEAQVHGMSVDTVSFHELGEWDSIADIVGAAFLICELDANWSVSPLPLGRGRVMTAHGSLPVPAPATALLLEGFDCLDDGIDGERVTPTGAAILRYLEANRTRDKIPLRLRCGGTGFGTRELPNLSNVLRLLAYEKADSSSEVLDQIAEILFEVDDQTPEDLAIALTNLRAHPGVRDVLQLAAYGKKGRMTTQVRVLADPKQINPVCETCFEETTTIGLRYQVLDRITLARRELTLDVEGATLAVKAVNRGSRVTVKAENDDVAKISGGHDARKSARRRVEDMYGKEDPG